MSTEEFKDKYSLDQRKDESNRIRDKYPDRVPVIVDQRGSSLGVLDKRKFLVPGDLTAGQFIYVIRKRIKLPPETAMFGFIGNTLTQSEITMQQLYHEHVAEDGFLYITIAGENTFG